jgi:hypothetical protein
MAGIYLGLRLSDIQKEASQKKMDAADHERLKASLPGLGYHLRMVAQLASMSASEFYGAANSKAVNLLLAQMQAEALQVSTTAGICCCMGLLCIKQAGRQAPCSRSSWRRQGDCRRVGSTLIHGICLPRPHVLQEQSNVPIIATPILVADQHP